MISIISIYIAKIETSMYFFINNNISKNELNVKISVAETTFNKTIHARVLSTPPIDSMNTVIGLNIL